MRIPLTLVISPGGERKLAVPEGNGGLDFCSSVNGETAARSEKRLESNFGLLSLQGRGLR
jgi:hypothetical protein